MIEHKACTQCKELKPLDDFSPNKKAKDGRQSHCRQCHRIYSARWRANNKEVHGRYNREWGKRNKQAKRQAHIRWAEKNPERVRELRRIYWCRHRKTIMGNLNNRMSCGIHSCIKQGKKGYKWESLVGYSVEDLKQHLEGLFRPGMSWENAGEWHIDHKLPLKAFSFETPDDEGFKKAWALENLQPLWAVDNVKKQATYDRNAFEKYMQVGE